ncbi:glycosyltransferase [Vibrio coralliirubri]|uniref:glycosyltransferase n=1 Tax=Vibrio coralliirubri TaxID=1516159 RepID=UPI000EFD9482|nr:glycosyltransferase [Vibrio coralliirubri]
MKGKVAVITSLYNGDDIYFAEQAINSLISQSYGMENINIYIHIDGAISNDHEEFLKKHSTYIYKIIRSNENIGLALGLNKLIDVISEEYVFRMDLDDISHKERFERQIKFMENNKVDICGCFSQEINIDNEVEYVRSYPLEHENIKNSLMKLCPLLHPTFCYRKIIFDEGVRYEDRYLTEDLGILFSISKLDIIFGNLDEVLFSWRKTDDFYKRRSFKRSIVEMSTYCEIISYHKPISLYYIYPILRFLFRLFPRGITKTVYNSRLRNFLSRIKK